MDTLEERAELEDSDEVWTWCRACGTMHPLDGPYGYFRHIVLKHPGSDQARAIVEALVESGGEMIFWITKRRQYTALCPKCGTDGAIVSARRPVLMGILPLREKASLRCPTCGNQEEGKW